MSLFFKRSLTPYVPGEQPLGRRFIKLNTNESPFPPCAEAVGAAALEAGRTELYSDPECRELRAAFCEVYPVSADEVVFGNGSDEILNFAFQAFCGEAVFPDITYGFYPVFAGLNGVKYTEIPLKSDFSVDISDYLGLNKTIFIANPNAPTGIALPLADIGKIVASNPDSVVVVDEAYVDFGAESAMGLIHTYPNLLVVGTFSKSRSMAGARLGFGVANAELIRDLETIRYSTNPYNVNRMTAAMGAATLRNEAYTRENCKKIIENREFTRKELIKLGFEVTDSRANFVFARRPGISGAELYAGLKEKGILIRHFSKPRIEDWNRITIGSREDMEALLAQLEMEEQYENCNG